MFLDVKLNYLGPCELCFITDKRPLNFRTADGYFYYPEGEVGYPVTVPLPGEVSQNQRSREI